MMKFKALTGFTSVVLLLLASAIGPREAAAQTSTGQIKGVVTDPTGAVVPGAFVTAISIDSGFTHTTISGPDGSFLIPSLDPQHYKVQIVAPTFEKLVRGPITVQVTETADIGHVALSIGEQTQTITVDAAEALIDTENSTLGKVFDSTIIEALPLSTRNFTQLLGLQAGVVGAIPDTLQFGNSTAAFSVGGGRTYDNATNIDGVSATSSSSGAFSVPSPDALAEFKMQTSTYSAEYGRAGGGSVDVTTKIGTNQFHGDGFYFFRNKALDANLYFNKQTEAANNTPNVPPDLRQNQFGGTIGGPVLRNKLFFFFSYQNTKQINGNSGLLIIDNYLVLPTGDRSNTPALEKALGATFGGLTGLLGGEAVKSDGSNINPVALALIQAKFPNGNYILPSVPAKDVNNTGENYIGQLVTDFPNTYTEKQYLGNVDYKLTSNQTLSTKYFNSHTLTSTRNGFQSGFTQIAPSISENAIVTHNFVISPTLVNEAKIGFLRQTGGQTNDNGGLTAAAVGMIAAPQAHGAFPALFAANAGIFIPQSQLSGAVNTENQYSISDIATKLKGHHNLRFGGTVMQHQLYLDSSRIGAIIQFNIGDFLIGEDGATNGSGVSNLLYSTASSGNFQRYFVFRDFSPFFQDDYKVRPNLTLNLGIRWDYFAWPSDTKGLMDNFVPSLIGEGLYGTPTPAQAYTGYTISEKFKKLNPSFNIPAGVQTVNDQLGLTPNYKNFAPRVGFAWNPEKNLSIRGGFGLFFTRVSTQLAQNLIDGPPFDEVAATTFASAGSLQDPFSHLNLPPNSAYPLFQPRTYSSTVSPNLSYSPVTPILHNPYTEQFNLSLQQQLGNDFLLEIAYQGQNGVKIQHALSQNQPGIASAANPIRGITNNLRAADTCQTCATQDATNTGTLNLQARVPVAGIVADEDLDVTQDSASSHFNALEATLSKRFSHGLQFLSAFTWSRAFDSDGGAPGDNNSTHNMSISSLDRTLRFTTSAVYQLGNIFNSPNNFAETVLNRTVGQWTMATSITAQTGSPIGFQFSNTTVGSSALKLQTNLTYNLLPGATLSQVAGHGAAKNRLNHYFNTGSIYGTNPAPAGGITPGTPIPNCGPKAGSVFVCPGPTSFGNLAPATSSIRSPGQKTVDFSLTKKLPIYKEYNLEFRADAFNLFNWANFGGPDANPGDASFGVITSTTVEPRVLQVAAKFKF